MINQIAALKLAVECLERERRRHYAVGDHAWRHGYPADKLDEDGIKLEGSFAEESHVGWVRYAEAIRQLEDLQEIIQDPGVVTVRQLTLIE